MRALERAESTKDVSSLVDLFSDDAELRNMALDGSHGGPREFWEAYLSNFADIRSTFTDVHATDDFATLEWTSEGTLAGGEPIVYRGVSLLQTDGERVRGFRTYYDTAVFLRHGQRTAVR